MEILKFKTTIKCSGCIAKATPFLDDQIGRENWEVNTENPDKVLTVKTEGNLSEQEVIKAVQEAGFKAEKMV